MKKTIPVKFLTLILVLLTLVSVKLLPQTRLFGHFLVRNGIR